MFDMRPGYAARRIASPTSREKRKPGTGRALAAFDGDLRVDYLDCIPPVLIRLSI